MSTLETLKNFLADRPEYAFLAFTLAAIAVLWRAYRNAEEEKLEIALKILPLADKLQVMLQRVAERRGRSSSTPPTPAPIVDKPTVSLRKP